MLLDFQKHIANNFSFLKNKNLLIAVSGGVDSVVLAHLLNQLNFNIALAHCNFRLRGKASDLDEIFVQKLAKQLQSEFYTTSFETKEYALNNNISVQMAARELRYTWFGELLKKQAFDYLLTAHHTDDNLETFLINLSRGTGLDGLTGIPAINNQFIRPLLPFTRKEIETFANSNKITWREDVSNNETKYLRNKLRHDVIPLLKEINPSLLDSFNKTLLHLQGSKQIVADKVKEVKNEVTTKNGESLQFKIQNLKSLSNPKAYLFEILNPYGFTEWDDVLNLLKAQPGKKVYSKTHRLIKDRTYLILDKINSESQSSVYKIDESDTNFKVQNLPTDKTNLNFKIQNTNATSLKGLKVHSQKIAYIDKSLLTFPLTVRKWEKGDYFYPLGMRGKKKLSKYFKDEKLSLLDKENIWLLCSNNDIVWIVNYRQDDRFKVNETTKNILKIEITT